MIGKMPFRKYVAQMKERRTESGRRYAMLFDVLRSFGVRCAGFIPLGDADLISKREYGFPEDAFVISFYLPYYTNVKSNLANFASARDYHQYYAELFRACESFMNEKHPGRYFRGFADVSPFAEVLLAAKCSLGVIGDHGMLITKDASSFIVLGEAVCGLSEDELLAEGISKGEGKVGGCTHCGECRRQCPADAADDKSRCISSITQKKGELSESEKDIIRKTGMVWGCDVCALACPVTKTAMKNGTLETDIPYFTEGRLGTVDEGLISSMSDEEYERYSFSWRKREVMIRNIRIASGTDFEGENI